MAYKKLSHYQGATQEKLLVSKTNELSQGLCDLFVEIILIMEEFLNYIRFQ